MRPSPRNPAALRRACRWLVPAFVAVVSIFARPVLCAADSATASASATPAAATWGEPFPAPAFPFGAVYFRKSSPPAEDWARDHEVAAGMGINIFRHWFMWASIENASGRYDWADYDRMVQLEGQNRIKVVIAENVTGAPEWMWDKYPRAHHVDREGVEGYPGSATGSATGSCPLCLDDDDVRVQAEKFLTALVERYRDKPALLGYDVWNEGSLQECTCPASQAKFREWLRAKYGTIEALGRAWHRYSLGDWDSVRPPRGNVGYPDALDWQQFCRDDALRLLRWRVDLIRRLDPRAKITAHGTGALTEIEWRTAADVDSYGYTWVASRHGNAPWMQFRAVDWTRAVARGKPFWHAEATGGPLWLQPQVLNRPLEDGRSSDEKDVRVWSLIDMAGGASGIQFTRWRPLLDGPLFGAFGPMGMDGSVTPRAEMAGRLARWANAHPDLWQSHPIQGDVGIVFVQEAADFAAVQGSGSGGGGRGAAAEGGGNNYAASLQGAYQAFFDSNIQADFVSVDDLARYPLVYLPYPEHLRRATAEKLRAYVAAGGTLVSEGCPGYFGDGGRVGTVQPNLGLAELFGARETYVQFTPDLLTKLALTVQGHPIGGQYFLQEYELSGGRAAGEFANGHLAAVEHTFGRGKTLLIGTFPGGSYERSHAPETRAFFAGLLAWAGVKPQLVSSDPEIKARLHRGAGGTYLWIVNPSRTTRTVKISLPSAFQRATDLWAESDRPALAAETVTATVEDRNAAVIRLE
ncbi:MAG TPA: alpha-amylase family protein [Opitutaceae bacterium]|nr:alpha-amylase family protein [Opitutaceae bacterium]